MRERERERHALKNNKIHITENNKYLEEFTVFYKTNLNAK